jgi:hypothetical protein
MRIGSAADGRESITGLLSDSLTRHQQHRQESFFAPVFAALSAA